MVYDTIKTSIIIKSPQEDENMERFTKRLEANGFEIYPMGMIAGAGTDMLSATFKAGKTELNVIYGEHGSGITARIDKPNGTHKWAYDKTPAQLYSIIKQTLSFYGIKID